MTTVLLAWLMAAQLRAPGQPVADYLPSPFTARFAFGGFGGLHAVIWEPVPNAAFYDVFGQPIEGRTWIRAAEGTVVVIARNAAGVELARASAVVPPNYGIQP